jgi:2'-5' RNA ligase
MGVAVEVYFDPVTEQSLRQFQTTLTAHGIPPILDQLGFRPHLSLAVFSDATPEQLIPIVQAFAHNTHRFALTFSHIGVFPTDEGVVFLAPTLTDHLATLHRDFHQCLDQAACGADQYYQPDHWVPHCTIAMDVAPPQVATAVKVLLQKFRPIRVQCIEIGIITFRPAIPQASFRFAA